MLLLIRVIRIICYRRVLLTALTLRLVIVSALAFSTPGVANYMRLLVSLD